jgi:hypothetical protein
MSLVTIVACAAGAYVAVWAVYLPIAYYFNRDAERDHDDDATPPWLPELLEMEQRLVVHQPYRPSRRRSSAPRRIEPSRADVGSGSVARRERASGVDRPMVASEPPHIFFERWR